jgi:hypothetical protein
MWIFLFPFVLINAFFAELLYLCINLHVDLFYRGFRDDIDQEDDQESFFRYMEENPMAGVVFDDDDTAIEYDAEGNPIIPEKNKVGQKLYI